MILKNYLLTREFSGKPIRVGLIGAGYAARAFALQCRDTEGIELMTVANRTPEHARHMLEELTYTPVIGTHAKKPSHRRSGCVRYTDDPNLIWNDPSIECVVEATGTVSFGAYCAIETIKSGKHLVLVNAELDGTLGPLLFQKAQKAGVVYTQTDGDQPAVIGKLFEEAIMLGLEPILAGNIKTVLDHYRTPETQKKWAEINGVSAVLATGAVDGTKLSFEMATVANATGFTPEKQGMRGLSVSHVDETLFAFDLPVIQKKGGQIDYILGAEPKFGVFLIAYTADPVKQRYLEMYKMGAGPYYLFYRPTHLCTLETVETVARAVGFSDAALAPVCGLVAEVATVAKTDLPAGTKLDGIGGFTSFGAVDNSAHFGVRGILPIGISDGCILRKPVKKDTVITRDHVIIPPDRSVDLLYKEQLSL